MGFTDLIFDLYGTLVDIHTEENSLVWEKTALFFGFYGAAFTGSQLQAAFTREIQAREAKAGQSYECFPDIPFEEVMEALFHRKGIHANAKQLGIQAAQLFRICSIEYIRVYDGAVQALRHLRQKGCRLWLLSNAQQIFTAYELRCLGLDKEFDGIYLSSDFGCRKPDVRFYRALLQTEKLDPRSCLMIGNDRQTDIAGAKAAGMATLYMHTGLTPPDQLPADPKYALGAPGSVGPDYEYEGDNWDTLSRLLDNLI